MVCSVDCSSCQTRAHPPPHPNNNTRSYEPKDPAIKIGMRQMLVQPGHLKSGFLLVTPFTSLDK